MKMGKKLPAPHSKPECCSSARVGYGFNTSCHRLKRHEKNRINPRFLKKASANLRRKTQKPYHAAMKGSKGRAKARLKLAKAHQRLANARADFQHKLSRTIVDEKTKR